MFLDPHPPPPYCSCVTPKMRWKAGLESPSRVSLCMPVCLWTSWQRARALFGTSNWKQLMMTATATATESEGLQFVEACAIILPHCISILAAFLCSARAFSHLQWWGGGNRGTRALRRLNSRWQLNHNHFLGYRIGSILRVLCPPPQQPSPAKLAKAIFLPCKNPEGEGLRCVARSGKRPADGGSCNNNSGLARVCFHSLFVFLGNILSGHGKRGTSSTN